MKQQSREEGVYYDESFPHDCCDECSDVTYDKTYPAHTPYYACINLKCKCHTKQQSHKEKIIEDLLLKIARFCGDKTWNEIQKIKPHISQAIDESYEEGYKDGFYDNRKLDNNSIVV